MFAIPFLAAAADAFGVTIQKIALCRKKMPVGLYLTLLFLFIFFISAMLAPFLGAVDRGLIFQTKYLVYFGLMVVLAVTWNYLSIMSLKKEKLYEHEMIMMLAPGATILLASIFTPVHIDMRVLVAALLAAFFLFVAKLERGHLDFSHYSLNMLIAVFLMGVEVLVLNELLKAYSPVSLYALRTGFIFLFYAIYFRPGYRFDSREDFKLVLGSALLGTICMIAKFYGYKDLGIVQTTVILIASPAILYLISAKYFKEKIHWKTAFSMVLILGCISYVTYIDALSR